MDFPEENGRYLGKSGLRLEAYQHQEVEAAAEPAQHTLSGEKKQMEIFKQSVWHFTVQKAHVFHAPHLRSLTGHC